MIQKNRDGVVYWGKTAQSSPESMEVNELRKKYRLPWESLDHFASKFFNEKMTAKILDC